MRIGRCLLVAMIGLISLSTNAQSLEKLILEGTYSQEDSILMTNAFLDAYVAVEHMHQAMDSIWKPDPNSNAANRLQRRNKWNQHPAFVEWLGEPVKMRMAHRKIRKMWTKFNKRFTLVVTKENKGACNGGISAWALPYGKVRIRLCYNFFRFRPHLRGKIIAHEIGHEVGMLFHRNIYGCWAARNAARSGKRNIAKRNPENYAWLAMSLEGLQCGF